MNVLD